MCFAGRSQRRINKLINFLSYWSVSRVIVSVTIVTFLILKTSNSVIVKAKPPPIMPHKHLKYNWYFIIKAAVCQSDESSGPGFAPNPATYLMRWFCHTAILSLPLIQHFFLNRCFTSTVYVIIKCLNDVLCTHLNKSFVCLSNLSRPIVSKWRVCVCAFGTCNNGVGLVSLEKGD